MNQKPKTYLCGPIGLNIIQNAKEWRKMVTETLEPMGICTLDPFDNIGNVLQDVRKDLHVASNAGDVDACRYIVSKFFIPSDLKMVQKCTFLTVYIPNRLNDLDCKFLLLKSNDKSEIEKYIEKYVYEICGSYGEATVAAMLHKPVLIITDRPLKPVGLPHWLVGCSTEIFTNWNDYFKYVEKEWGN